MTAGGNPMTAMSAMTRDHGASLPDLPQLHELLNEAKRQFLEAKSRFLETKRRYFMVQELVRISRIQKLRRLQKLEEVARLREMSSHTQPNEATDAVRQRLSQELNDNVRKLQKLKEIIRLREILLDRQQRALRRRRRAAAAQCLPEQAMRENIFRLQKLKELFALLQERRRRQERALDSGSFPMTGYLYQPLVARSRAANPADLDRHSAWNEPASTDAVPKDTLSGRNSCRTSSRRKQERCKAGRLLRLCELRQLRENLPRPRQHDNQARRCRTHASASNVTTRGPPGLPPARVVNKNVTKR
jgi:hypothetical protein